MFRSEAADFSGIRRCPHFPQLTGTRYGVQTSFTNQPLTRIGHMGLMKTKLRRRLDRNVTRSVLITKSRSYAHVAGWMIRSPHGGIRARIFDASSSLWVWHKETVNTIFSVCSQTQHKIQDIRDRSGFPHELEDRGWLHARLRPDGDNCALFSRQDAAAEDNGQCA